MGATLDRRLAQLSRVFAEGAEPAREAAAGWPASAAWLRRLVDACADEEAQSAASWLLLEYVRGGARLNDAATDALVVSLDDVTDGYARLHVCHVLATLELGADHVEPVRDFLRLATRASLPFLRAWSVDTLVRLAKEHDALRADADRALARARKDPAASVRARVRRIESGR